jgi:hypothetical protein
MAGKTHCARLLEILADGGWHTCRDVLIEEPMIVHSRVAELRSRGYLIEHETTGAGAAGSRYRLVRGLPEREMVEGPPGGPQPLATTPIRKDGAVSRSVSASSQPEPINAAGGHGPAHGNDETPGSGYEGAPNGHSPDPPLGAPIQLQLAGIAA